MSGQNNRRKYIQNSNKILGKWDAVAINIAIVLGVGIFMVPSEVAKYLSSPTLIILAWVLGGIISLMGAACYAELSSSFPKTGGNYVYLRESYGPLVGFLFGWTELLIIRTGSIAAVSFIFAEYVQSFLSFKGNDLIKPIAISSVLILSLLAMLGLQHGKRLQNASAIAKICIITAVIAFGIMFKKGDISHFHLGHIYGARRILPSLGLALIPILWTYGGWHESTFVAEEIEDAKKFAPFSLITGILIIAVLYIVINAFYIYLIPPGEIAGINVVASMAMEILSGKNGKKLFELLVIISSLGCLNAMILTGSRVTYAMAKDNLILVFKEKPDMEYGTLSRAITINAAWSIILILAGTFNKLLFLTGIAVWLFFSLAAGGIFVLRRNFPNIERPYKVWGYPFVPAIFIFVCVALFLNTLVHYPFQALIGLCLVLAGIPLFIILRVRKEVKNNSEETSK